MSGIKTQEHRQKKGSKGPRRIVAQLQNHAIKWRGQGYNSLLKFSFVLSQVIISEQTLKQPERKVYKQKYNWTSVFHTDALRFPQLSTVSESNQGNTAVNKRKISHIQPVRLFHFPCRHCKSKAKNTPLRSTKQFCWPFLPKTFWTHALFLSESHSFLFYCLEFSVKLGGRRKGEKKKIRLRKQVVNHRERKRQPVKSKNEHITWT